MAAASGFALNSPPGVVQTSATNQLVTATVSDNFAVAANTDLNGQISNFNGGLAGTDNGPTWSSLLGGTVTASTWRITNAGASDYVTRNTAGEVNAEALVRYMTRQSTLSVTLTNASTTTTAGLISGSNAAGSAGVIAVLFYTGGQYQFVIYRVDGADATSLCSTGVNTGAVGTSYTMTLTYTPATQAAATATLTKTGGGGGPWTVNSTCSLGAAPAADGNRAGMFSGRLSTTRFTGFSTTLV